MAANWTNVIKDFNEYLFSMNMISEQQLNAPYSDISIFSYAREFKEYISIELEVEPSTLEMSVGEILNMDIDNGQLVSPDQASEETNIITDILNTLFKEEDAKKAIDADESGELDKEEITSFVNAINTDENGQTISFAEIFTAAEGISAGNFFMGGAPAEEMPAEETPIDEELETEELPGEELPEEELTAEEALNKELLAEEGLTEEQIEAVPPTEEEIIDYFDNNEDDFSGEEYSIGDGTGGVGNASQVSQGGAAGSQNAGGASGGGMSPGSSSGGSSSGGSVNSQGVQEKTLDNMSKDELNAELSGANSGLADKKAQLSNILNGSDSELGNLQTTMDEAYTLYKEQLSQVDEQMAGELDALKNDVAAKEKEVDQKEQEVSDQECSVSESKTAYDNAVSTRESLESSLSSLESTDVSSMDPEKQAEKASKIAELKAKIETAKADEDAAKIKWEEAQTKLEELKQEKENLVNGEGGLNSLNQAMTELEAKISAAHPEVQASMDAYKDAKKARDDYKSNTTEKAKSELQESQSYIDKIQTAINNYDNNQTSRDFSIGGLTQTHILDGQEYQVVDTGYGSMQEFADTMTNLGLTNKGPYGTKQCFNFSQAYGGIIMGDSGVNLNGSNPAYDLTQRSHNSRPFMNTPAGSQQEALGMIKDQLDDGKPVVIKIYSKDPRTETHYGLAVGYNKNASGQLSESDILIIDSYDGNIEQLGTKRKLTGYKSAVWVYTPGYSYGNS